MVDDKRQEILEQIKRKNQSSSKILDKSKLEKVQRLIKMNKTMQTDKSIKKKMDEHFKRLEEQRVEIEKMVENKSNYINCLDLFLNILKKKRNFK